MDLQEEFNKLDLRKSFIVGFGIAAFYWFLLFDDGSTVRAQINQSRQDMKKARAAINRVKAALEDKKKFQAEIDEINLNMKDFQRYFSPDMDTNKLLSEVSVFAEKHSLSVDTLRPVKKESEFEDFVETAVEVTLEGSFHDVMEFISSLTKMEKAIDFSEMEFITVTKGESPFVRLSTLIVVYSSSETLGVKSKKNG